MKLQSSTLIFSALALVLGCAPAEETDAESSKDAVSAERAPPDSCSETNRAKAKQLLASAADHAKAYAAGEACTEEGVSLAEIAGEAEAAIAACAAFRKTIATSAEAKPVRDVLATTLALPILLGKIDVTDTTGTTRWRGLGDALAAGVTLYELDDQRDGYDVVGYTTMATLKFSDGHVIRSTFEEGTEETHTISHQGTFRLGRVLPRGGVELFLDIEGESRTYELALAPDGGLTVQGLSRDPAHRNLNSMPVECP